MYNEEYDMLCLSENEVDSGEPIKLHSPHGKHDDKLCGILE